MESKVVSIKGTWDKRPRNQVFQTEKRQPQNPKSDESLIMDVITFLRGVRKRKTVQNRE